MYSNKIVNPEPITLENYEKIQDQAKKCLCYCKIIYNIKYGTCEENYGLFCKIPFPNKDNLLSVLILKCDYYYDRRTICKIIIRTIDDNKEKDILLKDRITWVNSLNNIFIIEIKENEDNIHNFILVDDRMDESFNIEEALFNETVYTMRYKDDRYSQKKEKEKEKILISFGVIINDKINENDFSYTGDKYNGFLLMSIKSNKIIGNLWGEKYIMGNKYSFSFFIKLMREFIQDKFYLENAIKTFINSNKKTIIGRSTVGNIYLIEDNNKKYVIKEIENIGQKEELNFGEKNNALSRLNDKYIVKYYKIFSSQNRINILMEYAGNYNLQNFMQKNKGKLDEKLIENILVKICLGLKEIHEHSIIHRDLKPENIMINENNNIKIIDFGISKELVLTKYTKSKVGSFYYMAPEIRKEEVILYDNRVDIYSLGCIIYELFTGTKYLNDKMDGNVKKINTVKYNQKWQILIDSLLKNDYNERPIIDNVLDYFEKSTIIIENEINNFETHKRYYLLNEEIQAKNENLKELNKYNSLLYIRKLDFKRNEINNNLNNVLFEVNNLKDFEEIEFEKYFIPKKEGLYILKMILFLPLRNCSYMFSKCNFQIIDLSSINTINVTNMSHMFSNCSSLKKINLSILKTENVTDMSHMFDGCGALLDIDLSSINTINVTNMSHMFSNCSSLKKINLSFLKTENVTDMSHMFDGCGALLDIDLSSFNTKKVTNMSYMFNKCGITSIDLSKFDTNNLMDMSYMFSQLINLENIDLSSFNIKNVNNMEYLLYGSHSLQNIDISSFNSTKDINANHIIGCTCCVKKFKINKNFYKKYCSYISFNESKSKCIFTDE